MPIERHYRTLLCAVTAALALLVTAPARATCGPYEVAMYKLGSLYYLDEQTGVYAGIDKDVVDEVALRTGCIFRPFIDSRVRIWSHLADGSLDMSVSGIPSPEREQFASFAIYFKTRNYLLLRNDRAAHIDSLEAFTADSRLRLAVVKSFRHGATFDQWIQTLRSLDRVDEYADAEVVALMVGVGRADAFLAMPVSWEGLLKRHRLEGKVDFLDLAPDDRVPHGLVLSRKRIRYDDALAMRKAIAAMRADGTLESIFRRHLSPDLARRVMP